MDRSSKGALAARGAIEDWRPEDPDFWQDGGRAIARRNLWISVPCLLLSFAVWMVWSVVVAKLPSVGFAFTNDQLFWLASLPGLSGATLRIFYSFMPAIFGGRLWTTLATWSLMIPALGMGYAVQNPDTPYWIFLGLALLCGFGGGNFASSMANISFFFPKAEKGNALAINAGLGNLGVSVVQFVVPIVITAGVFGWLGGDPQSATVKDGDDDAVAAERRLRVRAVHRRLRLRRLVRHERHRRRCKASFADQSVIFRRAPQLDHVLALHRHLRLVHRLLGGVPAAVQDALSRRSTRCSTRSSGRSSAPLPALAAGKPSDRIGGGRITFWVFIAMCAGVVGVLYAIGMKGSAGSFPLFFASFLFLFAMSGIGNASTFQMIPAIMRKEIARLIARARRRRSRQAVRQGSGGDHRLHLGDRRLRRLLHPEELRHLDRHDRRGARPRSTASLPSTSSASPSPGGSTRGRGGLLYDVERGGGVRRRSPAPRLNRTV